MMEAAAARKDLLPLVADITAAYCTRGGLAAADVAGVIAAVFAALDALGTTPAPVPVPMPAVMIGESVWPDYLICLEDGRKFKMLRRHLRCAYNMTPDQYRAKWKLRSDYPMVAPNYSTVRSQMAVGWGFGRARNQRAAIKVNADRASDSGDAA
jgi:predicted transcriptional regulator